MEWARWCVGVDTSHVGAWGVWGVASPLRSSACRVPGGTREGQGQPWRLPASLAAPWAPRWRVSSGRHWGEGPSREAALGLHPPSWEPLKLGGRWPCPAGCPLPPPPAPGPPSIPGLMGSPPSEAELSACHARGPAGTIKGLFVCKHLASSSGAIHHLGGRGGGGRADRRGRGWGPPRMLPGAPSAQR